MSNTDKFARVFRQAFLVATVTALAATGFASRTQADSPPDSAPGAAPSAARIVGTWTILRATMNPRDGDKSEGTTYRFEEAGKVTVAGAKQCAYRMDVAELLIDCDGAMTKGKLVFRDPETIVWTIAAGAEVILKKR